ncbi:MAG TPA: tetratricopeptide repeat protein [Gemmatimonadaceae bacterium]|nr:tetratricopeptide repeat protein [Gemmatimonadaceae bacterium]
MNETIETRWEQENEAGRLAFTDGDLARAEQSFLAAIREATKLGADNVRLASSLSNLGQLKYRQKDFAQAEALFHRALAIRERVLGPEHFGLVQNINNLAALHYARNELDQAEPLFQRALGISQQHLGEAHPDVAVTLNNLARLYFRRNEYASAGPLLQRLLTIKEQALGASHPEIAAILTSLAKVRLHQQDYDGGEAFARRALEIREKLKLPNDLAVATALETLAEISSARGRLDDEIRHRELALDVRTGAMGPDHPLVVAARAALEARRAVATHGTATITPTAPPPLAPLVVAAPAVAVPLAEAPVAARPVTPPPSFSISPPPQRTPRPSPLPWISEPDRPSFDRIPQPSVLRNSGSNGTIAMPVRGGNGTSQDLARAIGATTNLVTPTAPEVESPLAFHPHTETLAAPRMPTPAAPSAPQHANSEEEAPYTNSFARLVADTPAARGAALEYDAPEETHHIEEPRKEISLDWPLEPARPWLKIAGAVAVLVIVVGGGWFFLSRDNASGKSRARGSANAATTKASFAAAKSDTMLVKHSPLAGPPASVVKPGVASQIIPSAKPTAAAAGAPAAAPPPASTVSKVSEGTSVDAEQPAHSSAKSASSSSEPHTALVAVPKLPTAKVDAITKMIDDSARRRADSVGAAFQQKPPPFKAKTYKAP